VLWTLTTGKSVAFVPFFGFESFVFVLAGDSNGVVVGDGDDEEASDFGDAVATDVAAADVAGATPAFPLAASFASKKAFILADTTAALEAAIAAAPPSPLTAVESGAVLGGDCPFGIMLNKNPSLRSKNIRRSCSSRVKDLPTNPFM